MRTEAERRISTRARRKVRTVLGATGAALCLAGFADYELYTLPRLTTENTKTALALPVSQKKGEAIESKVIELGTVQKRALVDAAAGSLGALGVGIWALSGKSGTRSTSSPANRRR